MTVTEDATIAGAAFFGNVVTTSGPTGSTNSYGMSLNISQTSQEVWGSVIVPEHYEERLVGVPTYGWVPATTGTYVPQYEWQVVGQDYYPSVYDENGNLIASEYWQDRYDLVYTHDIWVLDADVWGVVDVVQEYQQVLVPETTEPVQYDQYDAPIISQKASRSDANWTWEVPGASGPRTIMRVWSGGLSLPDLGGNSNMALTPSSLVYVNGTTTTTVTAGATSHLTQTTSGGTTTENEGEVRPDMLRVTRREIAGASINTKVTQVGPDSATFGGVVAVQGNLSVQGVIRVTAQGDLAMGEFTNGPQP